MLDVFRGLKGLVKAHKVTIDSSIFRLHYSATVTFLLAFSLIVTTRQGEHQLMEEMHNSKERISRDFFVSLLLQRV
jgi:hypothetical protein